MKWVFGLLALALFLTPVHSQAQAAKKKGRKPAAAHAGASKPPAARAKSTSAGRPSGSSPVRVRGVKGRRRAGKSRAAAAPPLPSHPDPERYQQIQQALTARGYFKGQVNGEWGSDSQEALVRFQNDTKLDADGKITALTLRGLGLGPKHDGSSMPLTVPASQSGQVPAAQPGEIPSLNAPDSSSAGPPGPTPPEREEKRS